jgi:2-polyprenyl-6-methoxyphenol hydroxylase-like FAD-dependent oxidoreductase
MLHPVLIAGAGPVGLTMAAELARYGVAVRIVDSAAERTATSKALVLWSRTLELIDRMGCGEDFVAAGLKATAANIIAGGKRVAHVQLDSVPTPHPYGLMLPQSETERLMEAHLNALGVRVERQVTLAGFSQSDTAVTASLRHADGREEAVTAPWLIGCDGAHSAVRRGLGMQFEGDTLPSTWVLADVHLEGLPSPLHELEMHLHADGVLALFPIAAAPGGGRYRMIADVGGAGSARRDPTLEEVQALLDRRGPGGVVASAPVWLAGFVINERKVAAYRDRLVFLAGDAAHIHSPAGGQGMNTGMQDAINLAWKLALVCRGEAAAEPLLDSYSAERSEIGRQVLANAGRLTRMAMLKGTLLQGVRNHVAALVFGLAPARRAMNNLLAELSIGYPHGPLTEAGPHPRGGPAAGERVPPGDRPLGGGRAPRFALFGAICAESDALLRRFPALLEAEVRAPFAEDGLWLVRPDGYVALTAARGDWLRIGTYLERIAGSAQ